MQSAMCKVQLCRCKVQCATVQVQSANCKCNIQVQSAMCNVRCAKCNVQLAVRGNVEFVLSSANVSFKDHGMLPSGVDCCDLQIKLRTVELALTLAYTLTQGLRTHSKMFG